jgi:hypothetical protein
MAALHGGQGKVVVPVVVTGDAVGTLVFGDGLAKSLKLVKQHGTAIAVAEARDLFEREGLPSSVRIVPY